MSVSAEDRRTDEGIGFDESENVQPDDDLCPLSSHLADSGKGKNISKIRARKRRNDPHLTSAFIDCL